MLSWDILYTWCAEKKNQNKRYQIVIIYISKVCSDEKIVASSHNCIFFENEIQQFAGYNKISEYV